jgi:hypothetical protein
VALGSVAFGQVANDGGPGRQWTAQDPFFRPKSAILELSSGYQVAPPTVRTRADGVFTWNGPSTDSWSVATNWLPNGVPNGTAATAVFDEFNQGGAVLLDGSFTINTLNMTDPLRDGNIIIAGDLNTATVGTLNFGGANPTINSANDAVDPPGIGGVPGFIGGTGSLTAQITGTNGLRVVGDAAHSGIGVLTDHPFSGGLFLTNTRFQNRAGDGGMGDASNSVTLTNSELQFFTTSLATSRTITVSGSSTITMGTDCNYSGNIAGTGALNVNENFVGGLATFTTANTFSGSLNVGFGTTTFDGGGFANATSVVQDGTLTMMNSGDHIGDSTNLKMRGAGLRMISHNEQIGGLTLEGGSNFIIMQGGSTFNGGALVRTHGAGVAIYGDDLGGSNKVFFSNGGSLGTRNGIIPFAYGHNQDALFTGIDDPNTNVLTYDNTNGVQMVTGQATDFTGATSTTNVHLSSNSNGQVFTVPAGTHVNTLVMSPPLDHTGMVVNGGLLNLDGGVLVSGCSGRAGLINPQPSPAGNTVSCEIDAGTNELFIITSGRLTQSGAIHGTGGLTKIGPQNWTVSGTSNYTGTTTLTGLTRFLGNVISGTPGPFGADTSAIELYGGNTGNVDPDSAGGTGFVSFGPDAGNPASQITRGLNVHGPAGALIRNFSNNTFTINGPISVDQGSNITFQALQAGANPYVLNGVISGNGSAGMTTSTGTVSLTINSANTFTGGFDMDGFLILGNDQAMGTGTVSMSVNVDLSATAPRTVANPLLLNFGTGNAASALTFSGTQPITFTGDVALDGTTFANNSSATVTFSGAMHHSNFVTMGSGTVVLSGNSDYAGVLSAGAGTTNGGMIILRSNNATGSPAGQSQAVAGSTVALDGNISIPEGELFVLEGDGLGGLGALRNLTGNNTWGGRVAGIGSDSVTNTVGVDGGSTLTIMHALQTNGGTDTFAMNKVGTGQLNVGSTLFDNGAGGTFNGAMLISGPLNINAGKVKVTAAATANAAVSQVRALNFPGGPTAPTTTLDVTNTSLVVDYSGASPIQDIRKEIAAGYASGTWTGPGITSSKAATSPNAGELHKTGLGYGEASTLGITSYKGLPVDADSVIIKYTYPGDGDLDGDADGVDIGTWATNFTGELGGTGTKVWTQGDWDYDGDADGVDAGIWAQNFTGELGGGGLGSLVIDEPNINPAAAAILRGMGITVVPEPVSIGVLGLGGFALMGARRRRTA